MKRLTLLKVECNEGFVSSAKGNLIVAIVPPVENWLGAGNVSESNHVVNLTPSMFTDPLLIAGEVSIGNDRENVSTTVTWWAVPLVSIFAIFNVLSPAVAAHDSGNTIWPSQHKGSSLLKKMAVFIK